MCDHVLVVNMTFPGAVTGLCGVTVMDVKGLADVAGDTGLPLPKDGLPLHGVLTVDFV